METWSSFSASQPDLAEAVRTLLYQYGSPLAYLATVRPDGGPRVHPVCPVIVDGGLFCFLIDSAKRRDLERDGRFALHTAPPEESDDQAALTGAATPVSDPGRVQRVAEASRATSTLDWRLFELHVDSVTVTRRPLGPPGTTPPTPTRYAWQAPPWPDSGHTRDAPQSTPGEANTPRPHNMAIRDAPARPGQVE